MPAAPFGMLLGWLLDRTCFQSLNNFIRFVKASQRQESWSLKVAMPWSYLCSSDMGCCHEMSWTTWYELVVELDMRQLLWVAWTHRDVWVKDGSQIIKLYIYNLLTRQVASFGWPSRSHLLYSFLLSHPKQLHRGVAVIVAQGINKHQ